MVELNYKELVKDIELEGLTLRKITNKYIKEHFDIDTLRNESQRVTGIS